MLRCCFLMFSGVVAAQAPTGNSLPSQSPRQKISIAEHVAEEPVVSAKVLRYAKRIIRQYDRDGNGRLDQREWKSMRGRPLTADSNRDQVITIEEFARHVGGYGRWRRIRLITSGIPPTDQPERQPATETSQTTADSATDLDDEILRRNRKFFVPKSRLPKGLPRTFLIKDLNGDGQLTLSEFAPKAAPADLKRFKQLDANGDGVVTAREYMRGPQPVAPPEDKTTEPPATQK